MLSRLCCFGFELLTTYPRSIASRLSVSVFVIYCRQLAGRPVLLSSAQYIIVMLGLQNPPSRLDNHHPSQQRYQYQPPQAPQIDLQRLEDAKRRAMASASVRRQHQAPGPTPLSRVWSADEDMTDEAPSPQSSTCPPSPVNAGERRSLFERTSFNTPPPTGPKADRDDDYRGRGRCGGQNRSAVRDSSPTSKAYAFLEDDAHISKAESAWNPDKWATAKDSTKAHSLFPDASVVAVKAADIPSPTPLPGLGRNDVDMEYVPPPALSPPKASWPTATQIQQQPTNMGVKSENNPAPFNFNFGNNTKAPPNSTSLTAFQPLASAVWRTPTTASFVKPSKAPLPLSTTSTSISTLMGAWSPPDVQMTTPVPTSHPRFTFSTSANQHQQHATQFRYTSPSQAMAPPHTMSPPRLLHLHIAPTAALNFSPPLPSPPLTAASSRPQLSTSIYLACLAKQEGNAGRGVKVMLKCMMMTCLQREGVAFGRESVSNGTVDRYRKGFGCGGCGEMLEAVIC